MVVSDLPSSWTFDGTMRASFVCHPNDSLSRISMVPGGGFLFVGSPPLAGRLAQDRFASCACRTLSFLPLISVCVDGHGLRALIWFKIS